MIDGHAPGVAPVIDPVGAVVLSADTSNVDTVIVGGKIHKRDGKLLADWESARKAVQASSEYLLDALAKKQAAAEARVVSPEPRRPAERPRRRGAFPRSWRDTRTGSAAGRRSTRAPGAVHTGFAIAEFDAGRAARLARPFVRGEPVRPRG